jgi:hypothetical protein
MYDFHQDTLVLPGKALYDELEVMSKSNYDKLCRLGKIDKVRTGGGFDNVALVDFFSIPDRFRVEIVKKLGYPPKKQTQAEVLKYYRTDYEAIDYFATYVFDGDLNRNLPPEKQDEYVKNVQMLYAVDQYIKNMKAFRKSRGGSLGGIWEEAAKAVAEVKEKIGHNLPKNDRRLRETLESLHQDGYGSLISKKFGNNSASKVKDMSHEALLRQILRDHRNLDNEQAAMIYNAVAKLQGFCELSAGTIGNYRTKWKLQVYAGTQGAKGFDNKVAMHVKRSAPSSPLLMWVVDGWDAELYFQDGKTFTNRLTMVVVLDPCIKYPIGYAIGAVESADLIKQAVRNAILHTEELFGQKHKVLQLQSDNYAKKKLMSFYEIMSNKFTPAKVGNAKSKVIEPWFRFFNEKYCQFAPNWSGKGVKSKVQPNVEMLNKLRHSFPDEAGVRVQLERMMEMERERLKDQYLAAYQEMKPENRKLMTKTEYMLHCGEVTGYTNKMSHNGLHVAINGRKREYDSFDANFRNHTHLDWTIKFDTNDLKEVVAYNEEYNLSFLLTEKYLQPMALADRKEGDSDKLHEVWNFNKTVKADYLETQAEDSRLVEQMFIQDPRLENTLAKHLIVDKYGQHKDRRNDKRLAQAKKRMEAEDAKIVEEQQKSWDNSQDDYYKEKINLKKYLQDD